MFLRFSNFGSLKSTETLNFGEDTGGVQHFSNFGSLKSTETDSVRSIAALRNRFQQFRLVEEH